MVADELPTSSAEKACTLPLPLRRFVDHANAHIMTRTVTHEKVTTVVPLLKSRTTSSPPPGRAICSCAGRRAEDWLLLDQARLGKQCATGSADARHRVLGLLKKPIFADLVEQAGGKEALLDARIEVIEGDLPNVPALPTDLDVLVHCAGDVSFDPPIDQAFRTNVVGTQALLEAMLTAVRGRDHDQGAEGADRRIPHYVHISTAYTAGRRRGAIPEAPHEHAIDYQAETRPAGHARAGRSPVADVGAAGRATPGCRTTVPAGRLSDHGRRHRTAPVGVGQRGNWCAPGPNGPARWAGPMCTPSPRLSANGS